MKLFTAILLSLVFFASCRTLNSFITVKPNDSFVLGDNEHGSFSVYLTNLSKTSVEVYKKPVGGESLASQTVAPNRSVSVFVPGNTALVIVNKMADTANVKLKVKGGTGLAMQYKK